MKTAISLPDDVYESAEKLANRLGKSRSQLYTQALTSYVSKHKKDNVTSKLNELYDKNESTIDEHLSIFQSQSLQKEDW